MERSIVMRKVTMAVCVSPKLKTWLKLKADSDGISMSGFLSQLISKAMREEDAK